MEIRKCTAVDVPLLARLNKQLIEDEQSDNPMDIGALEERMRGFLQTDYDAYFFTENADIAGYALVNRTAQPLYLRQFLIDRAWRRRHCGQAALALLLDTLGTDTLDLEVLSHNEAGLKFWESCGFTERSRYMRLEK